jgi:hypothetical protein
MSIKLIIQAPGLNVQAVVTDAALAELIRITQEYRDQETESVVAAPPMTLPDQPKGSATSAEEATKGLLASYGAAELLNHLRWETHPEKILLLAAWHEARGSTTPWKSADMDAVFLNAKERSPANFPRDIKTAIKSGWIHTHTPRTYSVTRTGWNKVAEGLAKLQNAAPTGL